MRRRRRTADIADRTGSSISGATASIVRATVASGMEDAAIASARGEFLAAAVNIREVPSSKGRDRARDVRSEAAASVAKKMSIGAASSATRPMSSVMEPASAANMQATAPHRNASWSTPHLPLAQRTAPPKRSERPPAILAMAAAAAGAASITALSASMPRGSTSASPPTRRRT